MLHLVSALGLVVFLGLAWCLSLNRKRFPWRLVLSGMGLQLVFALFILKTPYGQKAFGFFDRVIRKLLSFAKDGSDMVFGPLANEAVLAKGLEIPSGFVFVVTVTSIIVLISSLSAVLYHYGILQAVVRGMAWVMQRVMGTSGSESLASAANIFMGQTEAPLVIQPYLAGMTRSELMALMTSGMATIAGSVLGAYVGFGMDAAHLLTASVISAPAALVVAKIILPETEQSATAAGANAKVERTTVNGLDALCHGAGDGVKLAINVMAMLIAFVAVVALLNFVISFGLRSAGVEVKQPLQLLFGWLNAPFAWLMGVPWKDCFAVGEVLGERIVINEFIGYLKLGAMKESLDPRSFRITTYALCGFANFSSIAIQIGGIGALAPTRRKDLAELGLRSMAGGLLACYLTAAIAGILI
jgi:CNT family concentrative nucleoside transporter